MSQAYFIDADYRYNVKGLTVSGGCVNGADTLANMSTAGPALIAYAYHRLASNFDDASLSCYTAYLVINNSYR